MHLNSNYPIIVVGIEKQAAIMLPSTKPERTHMTTSTSNQTGLEITNEIALRMIQITNQTELDAIYASPAFELATIIIGQERDLKPRSIERRFGLIVELLKEQFSECITTQTQATVFGLLKAGVLTIEQAHACSATINKKLQG